MSSTSVEQPQQQLTSRCLRRIALDVGDVIREPLSSHGIYYVHDSDVVTVGSAMIIGAVGTPYAHGCYFFDVLFPHDYPISPPKVKCRTQDKHQRTRFHPNFYRNGKVCRAGLNTWKGQGWTSCMNLRSVLLDLAQAMNKERPIIEEPDVALDHPDALPYNRALLFKNYQIAVLQTLIDGQGHYDAFAPFYRDYYAAHAPAILEKLHQLVAEETKTARPAELYISMYEMNTIVHYAPVVEKVSPLLEALVKPETEKPPN